MSAEAACRGHGMTHAVGLDPKWRLHLVGDQPHGHKPTDSGDSDPHSHRGGGGEARDAAHPTSGTASETARGHHGRAAG